jgi:hypothetical protein
MKSGDVPMSINDAADFYDIARVNPGGVFIDEVQRTIKNISEFPEAAPVMPASVVALIKSRRSTRTGF